MKGHSTNSRFRLKTKSVHGIRTGNHSNPNVMKAARRADGGMCDGKPSAPNLGRMGRKRGGSVKKADGGGLDLKAGGNALMDLARLGTPSQGDPKPPAPAAAAPLQNQQENLERQTANLGRKSGGSVKKADGGKVVGELADELEKHELEHALLKEEKEAEDGEAPNDEAEYKRGGRAKKKG